MKVGSWRYLLKGKLNAKAGARWNNVNGMESLHTGRSEGLIITCHKKIGIDAA
jgi:hypothetical protein